MKKYKMWYTLKKHSDNKQWTLWLNKYYINGDIGGCGSLGVYSSMDKQECIEYCRKAGIKLEKENGYIIKRNNNNSDISFNSTSRNNTSNSNRKK